MNTTTANTRFNTKAATTPSLCGRDCFHDDLLQMSIMTKTRFVRSLTAAASALLLAASASAQGFKLTQGYLEPVIARANRPGQIVTLIQNTNASAANNLTVQIVLPGGAVGIGASVGLTSSVPTWNAGEVKQFTWDVQSSVATNATVSVLVKQGATTLLNVPFAAWWQSALTITNLDYVPAPVPANTGRYQVGAMICPFWRDTGYNTISGYPDRKPALGYYDEGDAEPTDWEVKWALEHGISYFVSCWYRNPANVGSSPVVPEHQRWLEGGFLNGRCGSQAKFAIMSVDQIVNSKDDLVTNVFPYWLENYFKRTNYLVLDNKPVLYFFSQPLTPSVMSNAISEMRAAAQAAGFAGLYVIGCYNGFTSAGPNTNNQCLKDAGMDYSYAYHLPTFMGTLSSATPSQGEVISDHQQVWDAQQLGVVPNLVTVSSGWDSEPWGNSVSITKWRLNPTSYTTLLQNAKNELDSRSGSGLETKLLLLDNWDEWGEGHFIGVTREYAWGYLDAVRQVFGTNLTTHTDLSPPDVGRGTPYYDGQDRSCNVQATVNALLINSGGTGTFQVTLSAAPTNDVTVTNTVSLVVTNLSVIGGAQLTFTPANWNVPQTVTIAGVAPAARKLYAFCSAGGNSGYADDWVDITVYAASTNPPTSGSWTLNGNGNWSTAANWQPGSIPAGDNATAYFATSITGSRTVTVDASPGTIRSLVFSPPGAHNWTLTNGTIQLAPASTVTVNANTATINMTLKGAATLTKNGGGTLLLGGPNSYTGGSSVQSGFLKAGATNAFGTQAVTVASGATLDANGNNLISDIIAAGAGVSANGAVVNTSGAAGGIQRLTLTGNTTMRDVFGGFNVFGPVSASGYTLTILGNPTTGFVGIGNGNSDLGDINIISGSFYANGYLPSVNGCLGRATNTITVAALGTLGFPVNGTATHNKKIVLNGGTIWEAQGGSPTLSGAITINSDSTFDVADTLTVSGAIGGAGGFAKTTGGTLVLSGSNTFSGTTTISAGTLQLANSFALQNSALNYTNGTLSFGSLTTATFGGLSGSKNLALVNGSSAAVALGVVQNASNTTYSGVLSGAGSVTKLGNGTLTLSTANTYSGNTIVNAGTLQLSATGSISNTPIIAVSKNAVLDVSALAGGFVLGTNKTLTGNGTMTGNLIANGTVIPGSSVGILSIGGTAILRGVTQMEIAKNASVRTNDLLNATGAISYGGSLSVSHLGPDALAAGDSFKLFNGASYSGAFTNLTLPAIDPAYFWTNRLALDGTLAVLLVVSITPPNLVTTVVGSTLQLSWPTNHIGWRLEAQTNALSAGLGTNWTTVAGSAQTNLLMFPIDPANSAVLYRLTYP